MGVGGEGFASRRHITYRSILKDEHISLSTSQCSIEFLSHWSDNVAPLFVLPQTFSGSQQKDVRKRLASLQPLIITAHYASIESLEELHVSTRLDFEIPRLGSSSHTNGYIVLDQMINEPLSTRHGLDTRELLVEIHIPMLEERFNGEWTLSSEHFRLVSWWPKVTQESLDCFAFWHTHELLL